MDKFPYGEDYQPAVQESWPRRHKTLIFATAAGLLVGSYLNNNAPKNNETTPSVTASSIPACSAESDWHGLSKDTKFGELAKILNVDKERAYTATEAKVVCDRGITGAEVMARQINVDGQDGPCLPVDVVTEHKPANPTVTYDEVIAVCAGPEPPGTPI